MAQVTKTYTFDSGTEGWSLTASSPATADRITTDGSPNNGCLRGRVSGRNAGGTNNVRLSISDTLANMGVPAGGQVSALRVYLRRKYAEWNTVSYGNWRSEFWWGGQPR